MVLDGYQRPTTKSPANHSIGLVKQSLYPYKLRYRIERDSFWMHLYYFINQIYMNLYRISYESYEMDTCMNHNTIPYSIGCIHRILMYTKYQTSALMHLSLYKIIVYIC